MRESELKPASGPYHVPNGRGAPDCGDELCGAASVAGASVVFAPLIFSLTHLSTSLARLSSGRLLAPCSVSIQQSSEARCCVRACGAASVAGASVGYPIRISLKVGLAARICGFEEAYSLFGDNAPIIFADTFGSARRLSPALQPPAKLASSPPPQSLPAATPLLSKPFSLKLLWFSFSSSASVSPRRSPPGAVQSDWSVMTI